MGVAQMQDSSTGSSPLRAAAVSALDFVVKAFAVCVPALYVLGRAYKEAYWSNVNLSSSLMDYSLQDFVYWGFAVALNRAFEGFGWMPVGPIGGLALVGVVLALISIVVVVIQRWVFPALKDRIALADKRIRAWRANDHRLVIQFLRPFAALAYGTYTLLFYFLVLIFLAASPILFAYSAGTHAAQRDRRDLVGSGPVGPYDRRALVHLKGDESSQQVGLLVECSTRWCVIFRRGDFVAVRQDSVASIDHCPQPKVLKNGVIICDGEVQP